VWSDRHLGHADSIWFFDRPFIDPERHGLGAAVARRLKQANVG
jgi:hypothetical protein